MYLDFDDIKNPLLGAGQATATYEVAKRMVKRGHRITVLSSRYPGYDDRIQEGIQYKHIGLGSARIKLNNIFYILAIPFAVPKIKADIIIECFTAPVSTLCSPAFTDIPVIALPSMFNAREFSRKYKLPFYLVERYGVRFYKYVMPYSIVDNAKIVALNPRITSKLVPQGVGDEYLAIVRKKPEHILFLGRYDIAQKGIDLLIEAYAKVADIIGLPLVIAGHGPDEKIIQKLIRDRGLTESVRMIGSLYGKEKYDVMARSAFVAFPSRHDELSLWSLEALGAGLPVVSFDLPEARWMPDSVALKAKPFDVDEYTRLLVQATNEELNKSMSVNARAFAKTYSWDRVVQDFEDFMREILQKEGRS